ncbi:hypothetical protein [Prescottella equi]|uniref:hypothetical protein n=1 Tax=Rhodococcus hoagii TaxID=43767 RepID=UPI0007CD9443|nr:hypothetical protein [Prescottella equi]
MGPGEGQSITVIRPVPVDRHRDPVDGATPAERTVDDVLIDWDGTIDTRGRRRQQVADVRLYCQPGSDIKAGDTVVLPGDEKFTVVSARPWAYGGWEPGVVVTLKGVQG